MKWKIEFFNEKVKQDTLSFPPKRLGKLLHVFELIENFGANLGEPFTKPLGKGLFEIRVKSSEGIGRSIYCYERRNKIMILHLFIKKTQKTPKKELEIALSRKMEVDNEQTDF